MKGDCNILLVESKMDSGVAVEDVLPKIPDFNYKLDLVTNYREGLDLLTKNKYNICLLEYKLGQESAVEFMQQAMSHLLWTPVIFIASENYPDGGMTAMRAGASDYLIKDSMQPILLERMIRFAIERKKNELQFLELQDELTQALSEIRKNQKQLVQMANLKSVQQLAAAIAHEFSQPLQALSNYFAIIKGGINVTKNIDKAETMLERITILTENLRNITGLSNKKYMDTEIMNIYSDPAIQPDKLSILIVGEVDTAIESIVKMFQIHGVQCRVVATAISGLALIIENTYSLILSDVHMQEMSGAAFLEEVRARGVNVPFIFLTGSDINVDIKAILNKADAFFEKPFNPEAIYKKVLILTADK